MQTEDADRRDAEADAAVVAVVRRGLFKRIENGHIWHTSRIGDLAALDGYVEDSPRFARYERGGRARLLPFRDGPCVMRRAIKFQVLERL